MTTLTSLILAYVAEHPGCVATEVTAALAAKQESVAAILASKCRDGILEHANFPRREGYRRREAQYRKPEQPRPRAPKPVKAVKPVDPPPRILADRDRGKVERWQRKTPIPDGPYRVPEKHEREFRELHRDPFAAMKLALAANIRRG